MEASNMSRQPAAKEGPARQPEDLAGFACPNPDCSHFNRFGAGNLSVCERMGKHKAIRRLYCSACGHRFSERQGTLLEYTKLPEATVVRIVKCVGHGCSLAATADICEVAPRTVERVVATAGPRAEHFHQLQLQELQEPVEVVELDELHAPARRPGGKKGGPDVLASVVGSLEAWARSGSTWLSRLPA